MRRYETMVIVDPDLSQENRSTLLDRMREVIAQQQGVVVGLDDWGVRKMAYEIKKKQRGHYIRIDYCGTGKTVDEIERFFRIDDRIMKYMTVLLEETADVAAIQESQAREKAGAAAAAEPAKQEPAVEPAIADAETSDTGIEETVEEE